MNSAPTLVVEAEAIRQPRLGRLNVIRDGVK
jgi:hypothetical protein